MRRQGDDPLRSAEVEAAIQREVELRLRKEKDGFANAMEAMSVRLRHAEKECDSTKERLDHALRAQAEQMTHWGKESRRLQAIIQSLKVEIRKLKVERANCMG